MAASIVSVAYLDGDKETGEALTRAGEARVEYASGDTYEGGIDEFMRKSGRGTYTWVSGAVYEGDYLEGLKHGTGTYTYSNGDQYEGEWRAGQRHGRGSETFANGDVFEGLFEDNVREGEGVYSYANGAELRGRWEGGDLTQAVWTHGARRLSTQGVLAALRKRLSLRRSKRQSAKKKSGEAPSRPLGVIISGAPASGKGTQCEFIREEFGLVHLSTGDMLRAAVAAGTALGKKAKTLMESGQLVPDDVVIGAVQERLAQNDVQESGFLLDGFPRTAAQAEALAALGVTVDCFVMLNVPDSALVARVVGRRIDPETGNSYHVDFNPPPPEVADRCVQRADDTEEKVKVRLQGFHANIEDIRNFYTKVTVEVDGTQPKEDVWEEIRTALQRAKAKTMSS